jgi:hypothetical protein
LIDWKTTTGRYAEEPDGLLTLDSQLICYSSIGGISDVAMIVFVRKQRPEIQYLKASISEEQRREFGRLVETTISQERAILIGLTNFRSNGAPLVAANLNRRRALLVLDRIDEILAWGRAGRPITSWRFMNI